MLTRKTFTIGGCVAAVGLATVVLRGETVTIPDNPAVRCADGACIPQRVTNGFYPTKWRRWPVEPPARPKPGVREGISAPQLELPLPDKESDLPEGAMTAPAAPAAPEGGAAPDTAPPRSTIPPTTTPGRTGPRTSPQPGLPPELRNDTLPGSDTGRPGFPMDNRSPRRMPPVALRGGERQAEALEPSANPTIRRHGESETDAFQIQGVLPAHNMNVEPQRIQSPTDGRPIQGAAKDIDQPLGAAMRPRWTPVRETNDQAALSAHMQPAEIWSDHTSRGESQATTQDARVGSPFTMPDDIAWGSDTGEKSMDEFPSDETINRLAPQAPNRPATAGLNSPASISSIAPARNILRASAVADLTISGPAASGTSGVLSVRMPDENWDRGAAIGNPLRNGSGVTKVSFESRDTSAQRPLATSASGKAGDEASTARTIETGIPRNPLR